mgnify:CR=1 FL=1
MNAIEFARAVASYAHSGQKDKAGKPYIMHPAAVSEAVVSDEEKVVALLHDVSGALAQYGIHPCYSVLFHDWLS